MDKSTLSNYGWIVVCVLVLAVMLALATPFGNFIARGFEATYTGFDYTANEALETVIGLDNSGGDNTPNTPIINCEHEKQYIEIENDDEKHKIYCDICGDLGTEKHEYEPNSQCPKCYHICQDTDYTVKAVEGDMHSIICNYCNIEISRNMHEYENGKCNVCGYVCEHETIHYISDMDNLFWNHINSCAVCGNEETVRHTDNNEDGYCDLCYGISYFKIDFTIDSDLNVVITTPHDIIATYSVETDGGTMTSYTGTTFNISNLSSFITNDTKIMIKALDSDNVVIGESDYKAVK